MISIKIRNDFSLFFDVLVKYKFTFIFLSNLSSYVYILIFWYIL